jgi:Tol biopolymer transport system component
VPSDTPLSGNTNPDVASAAFLAPPNAPGELGWLAHYRVLKQLGRGGMGLVFLAEDTLLGRKVALKVMQPALAADPANRDRFLREARAAAALTHDHVVTLYQVGEERGAPFLSMQLLQGESLSDYMKSGKRLTFAHICRIGREAAAGLGAAHARGLVHRDIKPANLWLETPKGRVKILDFGLARQSSDAHLTTSGAVLGTPAYMSPEQARALPLDGRSDLWSLGVILYRLCTGRLPFDGANMIAILTAIALDEPPSPAQVNPEVPPPLAELVMQLLAKDRDKRPATAQEVADRLQKIERALVKGAKAGPSLVIPARPPDAATQAPPAVPGPAPPRPRRTGTRVERTVTPPPKSRRGLLLGAGGLTAAVLLGGLVILIKSKGGTTTRTEPPAGGTVTVAENGPPVPDGQPAAAAVPPPVAPVITGWKSKATAPGFKVSTVRNLVWLVAITDGGRTILAVDSEHLWRRPVAGRAWTGQTVAATCRELYKAEPHRSALSSDGKLLALGVWTAGQPASSRLVLWDVTAGRPTHTGSPPATGGPVTGAAFSPDGQLVATAGSRGVQMWAVVGGTELKAANSFPVPAAYTVAFSPDGTALAVGTTQGEVRLIDRATGKDRWKQTPAEGRRIDGVVFSPDGRWLAANAASVQFVSVWDVATQTAVAHIDGGNHQPAFSPDGRLLAVSESGGLQERCGVIIFDLTANRAVAVSAREHTGVVGALAWTPDGTTLVSFGRDDTLKLWDVPKELMPAAAAAGNK